MVSSLPPVAYTIRPTASHPNTQPLDSCRSQQCYDTTCTQKVDKSIKDLPPELLGIIFNFYLGDKGRALPSLLLVCTYWYHIISQSPHLWSQISMEVDSHSMFYHRVEKHIHMAQLSAKNSGSLLLHINIDYGFKIPQSEVDLVRELIRQLFSALKGENGVLAARWGSLRVTFPNCNGTPIVRAEDCGLINLPAPNIAHISIEMLATAAEGHQSQPATYLTNLAQLRYLIFESEYMLGHVPGILEQVQHLELRLSQQPFNVGELARFPHLRTLILRHEEKSNRWKTAFSASTLSLLEMQDAPTIREGRLSANSTEPELPYVPALYIQSAWLMESELPGLTPRTLAWDPLSPSPLEQFKFTELAMGSIRTLIHNYPHTENLILSGALFRSFFVLMQKESPLPSSLMTVLFDMGKEKKRYYHVVGGKLKRIRGCHSGAVKSSVRTWG